METVLMETTGLRLRRRAAVSDITNRQTQPTSADIRDDSLLWNDTVRAEINAAFDESLKRNRGVEAKPVDNFIIIEQEAVKMFDSVVAAEERDDLNRRHNRRMQSRHIFLSTVGIFCMAYPVLLMFDAMMKLFPDNHVRTLEIASQQPSMFGSASRFCLHILLLARQSHQSNVEEGGAYLCGCLGALVLILLFVRHTTERRIVMTPDQRRQVNMMRILIQEQLVLRGITCYGGDISSTTA